jgi:hypothetical protein
VAARPVGVTVLGVAGPFTLIEFPPTIPTVRGDFGPVCSASNWSSVARPTDVAGRQARAQGSAVGIHERGAGPGDTASLPYFTIAEMGVALGQVEQLLASASHAASMSASPTSSHTVPFWCSGIAL